VSSSPCYQGTSWQRRVCPHARAPSSEFKSRAFDRVFVVADAVEGRLSSKHPAASTRHHMRLHMRIRCVPFEHERVNMERGRESGATLDVSNHGRTPP
jgi:hypothetical protein